MTAESFQLSVRVPTHVDNLDAAIAAQLADPEIVLSDTAKASLQAGADAISGLLATALPAVQHVVVAVSGFLGEEGEGSISISAQSVLPVEEPAPATEAPAPEEAPAEPAPTEVEATPEPAPEAPVEPTSEPEVSPAEEQAQQTAPATP